MAGTTEAHLLPAYGEYNVAYKNRRLVYDADSRFTTWDALGPVVIVNGRTVGTCKGTLDKHSAEIVVNAARTLSEHEQLAIKRAAERCATILGAALTVTLMITDMDHLLRSQRLE